MSPVPSAGPIPPPPVAAEDSPRVVPFPGTAAVPDRAGEARLKLAFIVTEFPKTTETFIMRDVMEMHRLGCEVRIFHLTHFNRRGTVHDFARPTLDWAVDYPYFASAGVLGACLAALRRKPGVTRAILRDILRGCRRDPVMLLKSLFILPKSLRIARALEAWGCDHIHAAYAGHPATAAWIAARMTGIPFSLSSHAHDLYETQALLAEKLPEAAFVRTISDYNRAFILDHVSALAARPPVVIHVGAELGPPPMRVPRARDRGTFRLLYVGSLEYRKGVDLLLQALARLQLPDWRLDILGDGPERPRLERMAESLGLGPRCHFHGRQRNEEVRQAMAEAALLVVPSRIGPRRQTEGLPTVIVEAFAALLPVVATRLTGIPEIVRDGETGLLFEREDGVGLARAIRQVHDDPEGAADRTRAGRALVEREFDQKASAARLFALIRDTSRPGGGTETGGATGGRTRGTSGGNSGGEARQVR